MGMMCGRRQRRRRQQQQQRGQRLAWGWREAGIRWCRTVNGVREVGWEVGQVRCLGYMMVELGGGGGGLRVGKVEVDVARGLGVLRNGV